MDIFDDHPLYIYFNFFKKRIIKNYIFYIKKHLKFIKSLLILQTTSGCP